MWQPNKSGEYFVDRDPKYFPAILNYFRMLKSGDIAELRVENLDANSYRSLSDDIDFYQIQSLKSWAERTVESTSSASTAPISPALQIFQTAAGRRYHLSPDETTRDRFIRFVDGENLSISATIPFEWHAV